MISTEKQGQSSFLRCTDVFVTFPIVSAVTDIITLSKITRFRKRSRNCSHSLRQRQKRATRRVLVSNNNKKINKHRNKLDVVVVVNACDLSVWEAKARGSGFKAILSSIVNFLSRTAWLCADPV